MKKKILVIQGSSLNKIKTKTDTTLFLALEAQRRKYQVYYYEPQDLSLLNGKVFAKCRQIIFFDDKKKFYKVLACCWLSKVRKHK